MISNNVTSTDEWKVVLESSVPSTGVVVDSQAASSAVWLRSLSHVNAFRCMHQQDFLTLPITDFDNLQHTWSTVHRHWLALKSLRTTRQSTQNVFHTPVDAEIEKICKGREASYARLAYERGSFATSIQPRIYPSPEGGIILETGTSKGTLNLIFEGDMAILIRATDDFSVQVNCNLNPESTTELLDIYESELQRI